MTERTLWGSRQLLCKEAEYSLQNDGKAGHVMVELLLSPSRRDLQHNVTLGFFRHRVKYVL